MDQWDEKAEALLACIWGQAFTPPKNDCGGCYACRHRPAVCAELRRMGEEIERLKILAKATDDGNQTMCDLYHTRGMEMDILRRDRDAAYLKGLEDAEKLAAPWGGTGIHKAIQSRIDEAKGK